MKKIAQLFAFLIVVMMPMLLFADPPDTAWTRTYGSARTERSAAAIQLANGDFIIAGYANVGTPGGNDFYVIWVDINGDTLWTRRYGTTRDDICCDVLELVDNSSMLAGYYATGGWDGIDARLYRIESESGSIIWERRYGLDIETDEKLYSVCNLEDGGLIAAGGVGMWNGYYHNHVYVVKTDSLGSALVNKSLPGVENVSYSLQERHDSCFTLVGESNYDVLFLKLDYDCNIIQTKYYGGSGIDRGYDVQITDALLWVQPHPMARGDMMFTFCELTQMVIHYGQKPMEELAMMKVIRSR